VSGTTRLYSLSRAALQLEVDHHAAAESRWLETVKMVSGRANHCLPLYRVEQQNTRKSLAKN
jgi:hypothetical protein